MNEGFPIGGIKSHRQTKNNRTETLLYLKKPYQFMRFFAMVQLVNSTRSSNNLPKPRGTCRYLALAIAFLVQFVIETILNHAVHLATWTLSKAVTIVQEMRP